MRRPLLASTLIVLVLTAAACSSDGGGDEDAGTPIEPSVTPAVLEGDFVSTEVTGHELVEGTTITLNLTEDQIAYSAGCNQMGGGYVVEGTTLRLDGPGRSTLMGCEPDLQAQDEWLTGLLSDGVEFELSGSELTLTSGDVAIVLEAAPSTSGTADDQNGEDVSLAGTSWTLDSVIEGDASTNVPATIQEATLAVDDSFEASVSTGCNTGGASVTVQGSSVTFGPMRLTRMACEGDAAKVEAAMTKVLDGETTATLSGDELTLAKGSTVLVFARS